MNILSLFTRSQATAEEVKRSNVIPDDEKFRIFENFLRFSHWEIQVGDALQFLRSHQYPLTFPLLCALTDVPYEKLSFRNGSIVLRNASQQTTNSDLDQLLSAVEEAENPSQLLYIFADGETFHTASEKALELIPSVITKTVLVAFYRTRSMKDINEMSIYVMSRRLIKLLVIEKYLHSPLCQDKIQLVTSELISFISLCEEDNLKLYLKKQIYRCLLELGRINEIQVSIPRLQHASLHEILRRLSQPLQDLLEAYLSIGINLAEIQVSPRQLQPLHHLRIVRTQVSQISLPTIHISTHIPDFPGFLFCCLMK